MKTKLLFCLIMACIMGLLAQGQVPQTIDFQGRMADSNGDPINGQHTITFSLFSSEAGGSALWIEAREVAFANGLFHVALGEENPIPSSVLAGGTPWLQIAIGAEVLSPRTRLNSAPFSRVAQNLVGGFADVTQVSVGGQPVINSAGQLQGPALQHNHSAMHITSGSFDPARIPTLDILSKTSNTLTVARGGTGTTSFTSGNVLIGNGTGAITSLSRSGIDSRATFPPSAHNHSASEITSGVLSLARIPTGTTNSTVALGDHTHAQYITAETDPTWNGTANQTGNIGRSGNVGIGTTTPTALLHTLGTGTGGGNVLFVGSYKSTNPGDPPASGAGTRMMWYPDKAAFRAGTLFGSPNSQNWDKDNIGYQSFATGFNTKANGNYSTAFGLESNASGLASTAMGNGTAASGDYSTAMGNGSIASGNYSFAINLSNSTGPIVNNNIFRISGATEIGGNVAWTNHSDSRLKKEIQYLETENNLEKIMQLQGVRFQWKESNSDIAGRYYIGFLAQDVLEILPEPVLHDELNDIYSMEYTALIPVLVEAMKEQQAIIKSQQSLIEELFKRLENLEGK